MSEAFFPVTNSSCDVPLPFLFSCRDLRLLHKLLARCPDFLVSIKGATLSSRPRPFYAPAIDPFSAASRQTTILFISFMILMSLVSPLPNSS